MCGILGFYGEEVNKALVSNAFGRLSIRGSSASGYSIFDAKKHCYWIFKDDISSAMMCKQKDFHECMDAGSYGILHARYTTRGSELLNHNNHPFYSEKHHYSFVHNGVISNYDDLVEKFKYKGDIETDSWIIGHILDMHLDKNEPFDIALRKSLRFLKGSFTLAFMFAGRVYLVAKDNPLEVYNINGVFYFCSTKTIFDPNNDYIKNHICSMKDNGFYVLENKSFIKLDDIKTAKEEVYVPITTYYGKYDNYKTSKYYTNYADETECYNCGDWECDYNADSKTYLCKECLAFLHIKQGFVTKDDLKYMSIKYPESHLERLLEKVPSKKKKYIKKRKK